MKKCTTLTSCLLLAAIFYLTWATPICWAKSSGEPAVIRKKIAALLQAPQGESGSRISLTVEKKPALQPKSEIALTPQNTVDDATLPANSLLAQNSPPVYNPRVRQTLFNLC